MVGPKEQDFISDGAPCFDHGQQGRPSARTATHLSVKEQRLKVGRQAVAQALALCARGAPARRRWWLAGLHGWRRCCWKLDGSLHEGDQGRRVVVGLAPLCRRDRSNDGQKSDGVPDDGEPLVRANRGAAWRVRCSGAVGSITGVSGADLGARERVLRGAGVTRPTRTRPKHKPAPPKSCSKSAARRRQFHFMHMLAPTLCTLANHTRARYTSLWSALRGTADGRICAQQQL